MHDDKILITETSTGRLYLYWEEYQGRKYLHLRYWYLAKDGEWKPRAKGIAIPESGVKPVLEGFRALFANG